VTATAQLLLVEDDELNALVLKTILSEEYDVACCASGEECITYCQSHLPDVILMDVEMPGMNGLETCKRLKKNTVTVDIPVIFVTSHHQDQEQTLCWEAGGSDFVVKPVNALTLKHRVAAQVKLTRQHELLKSMAFIDGLTGVYNRHYLTSELDKKLSYAKRNHDAFSLIMADIDWFKKYNDFYGHLKGDDCLKRVANIIKDNLLRGEDSVVRYGGEEFVCIVPQVDQHGLETLSAALNQCVYDADLQHESSPLGRITLSIGGVYSPEVTQTDGQVWLGSADKLLYRAKHSGKNQASIKEL
jgi:diguanylate cyclase (GGDEF)-like protein